MIGMTIAERITYIIDNFCDGNANEFARKTRIGKSAVSMLRKGAWEDRGIGAYAERIAMAFPRINCRWLLTGVGAPCAKEATQGEVSAKLDKVISMLAKR